MMTKREKQLLESIGETPDNLVFWAFRYFLGRGSIVADQFARNLAKSWGVIDYTTRRQIAREIDREFARKERLPQDSRGYWCQEAWEEVRKMYGGISK